MEVMKPVRNRFILLSICPANSDDSLMKFRNRLILGIFFSIVTCCDLGAIAFVSENLENDLENCLHATLTISVTTSLIYMLIASFILRHKITEVFDAFQDHFNKYKYMDSGNFMQKANDRTAKLVEYGDYFMGVCCLNIVGLTFSSLMYSYWEFGSINPDVLYRPARLFLPWDQYTLSGWMIDCLFSVLAIFVCLFIGCKHLTFFISFFFFNFAFYQIFSSQYEKINSLSKSMPLQSYEIKRLIIESISFHISAKKLVQQTASVYGTFLLSFLISVIISVATSVFEMDLAVRHLDLTFFLMFYSFIYGLSQLYAYCYVGKHSTDYFLAFADCLYESNWMDLPLELARSFPMMIAHAQRPLYYHGANVAIMDMQLFTRTIKTVFSYYLMFKTLVDM